MVDKTRHLSIVDAQRFRGAECESDNYLVVAKLSK
jgi:hypothetical protein